MKKNMGVVDRVFRIVVAIVVALLFHFNIIGGVFAYVLLSLSAVFLFTSITGFCPVYIPFGFNTCKLKE
ncbi:YgaP family membrane protein [Croceivirga radicis]|uniref:YgaP family membrane protein n=1 Tax=Croceivirga radicis TaxID=1929488 RepID=UPI000255B000|nr:DUF2892 domain-containing protein [Croceivirga radicis]